MSVSVRLVLSLEKIRSSADLKNEISHARLLRRERFCCQVAVVGAGETITDVVVESALEAQVFAVRDAMMDYPLNPDNCDDDYIATQPGPMPDILIPLRAPEISRQVDPGLQVFWLELSVPEEQAAGEVDVTVTAAGQRVTLKAEILDGVLPEQKLLFTQWFHVDCIATIHGVGIYSEEHWTLIDRYMAMAASLGMNMILTPVITPPLDTQFGTCRPNTQLVMIDQRGGTYSFDFSRLRRWLSLCRKNGIQYFEISHLYSQWGADFAPNIFVTEAGEEKHLFGWHVKADDPRYEDFLRQFLPALVDFLKGEGVAENCYFHISDEPSGTQLDNYRRAWRVVKPLVGECHMMDALSHYEFYREGLVENPVCANDAMEPFLENGAEDLWTYYCCAQGKNVGNRFLAMPSYRNRILGLQMYKFGIKGFLHWGYNFYYSQLSRYPIDPYRTTSADRAFPSGDPFSVYPGADGPLPSLRAMVFREALQDIRVCRALEERIGRDAVIAMIDEEAGMKITFTEYPRNSAFVPQLMEKMKEILK